jgi:hypothetical protein
MLLEITTLMAASRLAEVERMLLMGRLVIRETRTGHKEEVHDDKNK